MRSQFAKLLLLCTLVFLVSCGQDTATATIATATTAIATTTSTNGIAIQSDKLVERLIIKEFLYNNCSTNAPLAISLTYKEVLSESLAKELVLGGKGSAGVEIPEVAKVAIEAEIKERFASEKTMVFESSQAASFSVPEFSGQKITITLKETLREGSVSYAYEGETHGIEYSYRINLEFIELQNDTLTCPVGSESAPPPIPLPTIILLPPSTSIVQFPCGDGFDMSVWTPVTTNQNITPANNGVCWQLGDFGMSMFDGPISILENDWSPTASWYGVTRRIQPNSRIRLDVKLEKLLNGQIWIGYAFSPDNINNGLFLVIKPVEPSKSGNQSAFRIVEMYGGQPSPMFDNVFVPFDTTGEYKINLEINENRLSIWLNDGATRAFPPFEVTQPYFFIGYLSNTGLDIDATVSNIQIQP